MDLAPAPMMLTVTGKRTRRQGVVNVYQSYTAKDCCCTLVYNSGPQLAIRVEVFGRRDTAFVNFRLKANSIPCMCPFCLVSVNTDIFLYYTMGSNYPSQAQGIMPYSQLSSHWLHSALRSNILLPRLLLLKIKSTLI